MAKDLIRMAKTAGCDYVKFQKRTVEKVYTREELDRPRESPWGTTNRQQKEGLEFGKSEYDEIDLFCRFEKIPWYASPWDIDSIDFVARYDVPYIKIPSALITDLRLLEHVRSKDIPVVMSTGMSTGAEVRRAVAFLGGCCTCILACTSTYPTKTGEMNMNFIKTLKEEYPRHRIGFSNHHPGTTFCVVAAALGAEMIEYHVTLDRSMYGSDQAASIELPGMMSINKQCRSIQDGMGTGTWTVFESELAIKKKLRQT